jgi:protein-tyrosine phosphatase
MALNPRLLCLTPFLLLAACALVPMAAITQPGEKAPSEDPLILDFHALGPINGHDNIYRSASPVRDLTKAGYDPASAAARAAADERMKSLYARGIRTLVSFESADTSEDKAGWMDLEKAAAQNVGLKIVAIPLANSGPNSLQTATDEAVLKQLQTISDEIMKAAQTGGVDIHCSAGHDRTGIVVAFMRIKCEHWSADRAIAEMRFYGHNWPKLSSNGGASSWHEDHLRAIAAMLNTAAP